MDKDRLKELLSNALFTGEYICSHCGSLMKFEDPDTRRWLLCPSCGHGCDLDDYGNEDAFGPEYYGKY